MRALGVQRREARLLARERALERLLLAREAEVGLRGGDVRRGAAAVGRLAGAVGLRGAGRSVSGAGGAAGGRAGGGGGGWVAA